MYFHTLPNFICVVPTLHIERKPDSALPGNINMLCNSQSLSHITFSHRKSFDQTDSAYPGFQIFQQDVHAVDVPKYHILQLGVLVAAVK
mmetsp:Transcript_31909/g.65164  ORF Transcript_31909/g.65164 Transcript_31909/m.65164 type:complete len:89 (-) Transcript_31909:619-885(-)